MVAGELRTAYDARDPRRARELLARPRFDFDSRDVREMIRTLAADGHAVSARPSASELPDSDDLILLEVSLLAAGAGALVTGNFTHHRAAYRGRASSRIAFRRIQFALRSSPKARSGRRLQE